MPPSSDQVVDALRPVQDPELHRSIVDLGMVRNVSVSPQGQVAVTVALTVQAARCATRSSSGSRPPSALSTAFATSPSTSPS